MSKLPLQLEEDEFATGTVIFQLDEFDATPYQNGINFGMGRETENGYFNDQHDEQLSEALERMAKNELKPILDEFGLELWVETAESLHEIHGFADGDRETALHVWQRIKEKFIEAGAEEWKRP